MKNLLLILTCLFLFSCGEKEIIVPETIDQQEVVEEVTENTDQEENEEASEEEEVIEMVPQGADDFSNPIAIRVVNDLDALLENVNVEGLEFGNLAPGQTSRYLSRESLEKQIIDTFCVDALIDDKPYNSLCHGFCGMPPYDIFNYQSGIFTIKIRNITPMYDFDYLHTERIEDSEIVVEITHVNE